MSRPVSQARLQLYMAPRGGVYAVLIVPVDPRELGRSLTSRTTPYCRFYKPETGWTAQPGVARPCGLCWARAGLPSARIGRTSALSPCA